LPRGKASDIKYADLDQSTPYSHLTHRNIGQRYGIFSCFISYLRANAMQATNQGVGSSNLSGRANKSNSYTRTSNIKWGIFGRLGNIFRSVAHHFLA
jgi:hypothetical protein